MLKEEVLNGSNKRVVTRAPVHTVRLPGSVIASLRCPVCGSELSIVNSAVLCRNPGCGTEYPIVDGVPILLNQSNSIFAFSDFVERRSTYFPPASQFKRTLLKHIPTLSANLRARENYKRFAELVLARGRNPVVLVVGGSVTGVGAEDLLGRSDIIFVESDVALGPRTTLVCDAHDLPFVEGMFDGVIVQAVLEHVLDPGKCVSEIHRVMKPGGVIYAETPFMQQLHGRQFDFTRFTLLGHRRLLRGFTEIASGAAAGPGMALAWSYQYFLLSFTERKNIRNALILFGRFTAFWLKYLDHFLLSRPAALDAASAFYFLGVKAIAPLTDKELVSQYRGGF